MKSPTVITSEIDLSHRPYIERGLPSLMIGNFDKGRVGERMFLVPHTADQVIGQPKPNSDMAYHILHSLFTKAPGCWATRIAPNSKYGGVVVGSFFVFKLGEGNDDETSFTGTHPLGRCFPGLCEVWVDKDKIGYDNEEGTIYGTEIDDETSTVSYETGTFTLNFTEAPPDGASIYVGWGFPVIDFESAGVPEEVYYDPTVYDWKSRDLSLVVNGTGDVYSDKLVPFPVEAPEGEVLSVNDALVTIKDDGTVVAYVDEFGNIVEEVGDFLNTDSLTDNSLNYVTGELNFTKDSGYTPTGDITVHYKSEKADCMLVYQDNPGDWGSTHGIMITYPEFGDYNFLLERWYEYSPGGNVTLNRKSSEYWRISRQEKLDGFSRQMYLEDRINDNSHNVRVLDNPYLEPTEAMPSTTLDHNDLSYGSTSIVWFTGGENGDAPDVSDYINALNTYSNKEDIDVKIILDTVGHPTYQKAIAQFTDRELYGGRGDCYGYLYMPFTIEENTNYLTEALKYRNYTLNEGTSFCGLYTGHVKIRDNFNGRDIYIPPVGFVGGAMSYTSYTRDAWWAAAGWERGMLPVLDLYRKLTLAERDQLYPNGINCMRYKPGRGIAIWGQRTLYPEQSARNRANVRWLLIGLEGSIEDYLDNVQFEFNDAFTRNLVRVNILNTLKTIERRRGLYDVTEDSVVCDSTNNTPDVIDDDELIVHTYVKPIKVIEGIRNVIIITKTGDTFSNVRIV